MQLQQRSPRFVLSIFISAATLFDDGNTDPRGEFSHGGWKIDVLVFHDEPENAPADATAEAMKGLALGADVKRGRFFLMKRAERLEVRARAFQRKIGTDHFDHVIRGGDLLDCLGWNHVRRLFFARLLDEAMSKFNRAKPLSK
jgi:hypothetical protein